MNILLAEDEQDLRTLISLHLSKEGFKVFEAEDGEAAIKIFNEHTINLAILDVMMPKVDGFSVINEIRSKNDIPVIFVTARGEDCDKILGLGLGADDYVVKPFSPIVLMARVQAQLRRYYKYKNGSCIDNNIIIGDLTLNKESCILYKKNSPLELNAKEYKIIELLMENPGKVYTKKQLYEKVWEDNYYGDDNTIMVHISHLRDKIEDNPRSPEYLKTIRGIGYKLERQ